MQDLALNSDFSVHLDDRNDLAVVEGQRAFEQSVAVMLTDFMYESVTGLAGSDSTIREKLRLEATRVARQHGALDSIVTPIEVEQKELEPGTYTVTVDYIAGDSWEFDI